MPAVHQSVDKLATEVSKLETQVSAVGSAEAPVQAQSRRASRRQ
jgi:hypothetical protein